MSFAFVLAFGLVADALPPASAAEPEPDRPCKAGPQSDLAYLSRNTLAFVRIQLAPFWQSDTYQRLRKDDAIAWARTAIQKKLGVDPTSFSSLLFVVPVWDDLHANLSGFAVLTGSRPLDRQAILNAMLPEARQSNYHGKAYFTSSQTPDLAAHFGDDRTLVLAPRADMRKILSARERTELKGPLAPAFRLARGKHTLVIGFGIPSKEARKLLKELGKKQPSRDQWRQILSGRKPGTVVLDFGNHAWAQAVLTFPDEKEAKDSIREVKAVLEMVDQMVVLVGAMLAQGEAHSRKKDAERTKAATSLILVVSKVHEAVEKATIQQEGITVRVTMDVKIGTEHYIAFIKGVTRLGLLYAKKQQPSAKGPAKSGRQKYP